MKTTKLFSNETTYQNLQSFESIDLLNESVAEHKQSLIGNDRETLHLIAGYAAKYFGVCYLSKAKIADQLGVSKRTVIRVCKRLENQGVITQYELKRESGDRRQAANAIVIQPVSCRVVTPDCHPEETRTKHSKNNIIHILETASARENEPQPANALAKSIPAPIFKALKPFLNAEELYDIYGVLLRAKATVNRSIMLEDVGERDAEVFQNIISKFKRGKVRNLADMLFASWRDLTVEIDRELAVNGDKVSDVYFDWLAE